MDSSVDDALWFDFANLPAVEELEPEATEPVAPLPPPTPLQRTYDTWVSYQNVIDEHMVEHPRLTPETDERFQRAIAQYPDLDAAFVAYDSTFIGESFFEDDGELIICLCLVSDPEQKGYAHLVPAILRSLFAFPHIVSALVEGFDQIRVNGCSFEASLEQVTQVANLFGEICNGIQEDGLLRQQFRRSLEEIPAGTEWV